MRIGVCQLLRWQCARPGGLADAAVVRAKRLQPLAGQAIVPAQPANCLHTVDQYKESGQHCQQNDGERLLGLQSSDGAGQVFGALIVQVDCGEV